MNQFTIRDIENLCGIKAHTLRAWENRYNIFIARRKESQHRIYDDNDLKELLRISFLYHNGYKISDIAAMNAEAIQEAFESAIVKEDNHELFIHQMIEASISFDKEALDKIVNSLSIRIGMEKAILNVFYPFLKRIGLLWLSNNVIPAQEHFASHIIRKKIIMAIDGLEPVSDGRSPILVFSPAGEHHEIPLLTANYFLRKYNNPTVYFGVDVSLESIRYYLDRKPVTIIFSHIVTKLENAKTDDFFNTLSKDYPGIKILVSGMAADCINHAGPNFSVINGIDKLIEFAKQTGAVT
jgi:MerR family transcriptional regulator, light-induced transcriptional regulator